MTEIDELFDESSFPITCSFFARARSHTLDDAQSFFKKYTAENSENIKWLHVATYIKEGPVEIDTITLLAKEDISVVQERHEDLQLRSIYSLHKNYPKEPDEILMRAMSAEKTTNKIEPVIKNCNAKIISRSRKKQSKTVEATSEKEKVVPKQPTTTEKKNQFFQQKQPNKFNKNAAKTTNKSKKSKPEKQTKITAQKKTAPEIVEEKQLTKKRKIITFSSSDEDDDANLLSKPIINQPKKNKIDQAELQKAFEPKTTENKDYSEKNIKELPKETEKRRRRGRRSIAKTFLNKEGFMVTEKGWESFSETDSESENTEVVALSNPMKQDKVEDKKSKQSDDEVEIVEPQPKRGRGRGAGGASRKRGGADKKGKQTSLMSFFKRT